MVKDMDKVILIDTDGKKYNAKILFTHFDYKFSRNYIVYSIEDDILASAYLENEDNQYIIDNDLSSNEYDMLDQEITKKLGENNA